MQRPQPTPRPGSPRRCPRRTRILDPNRATPLWLSGHQGILAGVFLTLLLAAAGVGLAGAGRLGASQAHASRPEQVRQARAAASLPAEGRWVDTTNSTAYQVQLQPNSDGVSIFAFTTSLGQQVEGELPLAVLADGTLGQAVGLTTGAASLPATTPPHCLQGTLQGDTPLPILYTFFAHISSDGLGAFAILSYANARDKIGITNLCQLGQGTGVTTYQLAVGCTQSSCTNLAALAGPSVANHDSALLAAEQNGSGPNWSAVYQLTSRQVTAQYSPNAFAALLNGEVKSVGKITAISAPPANPPIQFTPEGQAYFAVQQTVTYRHKGNSHTRMLTSYYVLENGAWLFWFTA